MSRKNIVIVSVGILLVAILWFWLYKNSKKSAPAYQAPDAYNYKTAPQPIAYKDHLPTPSDYFPTTKTIQIATGQGIVETNNFYTQAIDTEDGLVVLKKNQDYQLSYDRSAVQFDIYLFSGDTASQTRISAEKDLLDILGINQSEACKLNLAVFGTNKTSSGNWSFCLI